MKNSFLTRSLIPLSLILTQCADPAVTPADGTTSFNSLVNIANEPAGENCSSGGIKISVGQDDDSNGILSESEIESINFICNGGSGTSTAPLLSLAIEENPGLNCPSGGTRLDIGIDSNGNDQLDQDEILSTFFVCNGENGTNGNSGANGLSTLTRTTLEPSSSNCANGGLKIELGTDDNENLTLEDEEVQYTYYVCNGTNGTDGNNGSDGLNTIIITTSETPGANCPNGGLSFQVGLDVNSNNMIDIGEEVGTYYVCNGSDGTNGGTSLITVSAFSDSQGGCNNGGLIIRTGIDDDENGVLDDPSEVDATSYVCNGDDGSNGASDNVFEFYFSEGFDGYKGVRDVSITDKDPAETGDFLSVDRLGTDSHGLIYFPEIEKMQETIGTTEYEIVEAILYLKGVSTPVIGASLDNWIGVKNLRESAPLFVEDEVGWINANSIPEAWASQGADVTEVNGAFDYSDMFRLPQGIQFNGYIPLLLNKTEVQSWAQDASNNKGLVLTMVDDGAPYELDIYSSNYIADTNFRPMLYVKVKITSESGRDGSTEDSMKNWNNFSYERKLAPLRKILAK